MTTQKSTWAKDPLYRMLDRGIRHEVMVLRDNGVHTTESCEGTAGHCYAEPTVEFAGDETEGFKVLAIAMQNGLPIRDLRRVYKMNNGVELTGPFWQMTFWRRRNRGGHG